MKYIFPILLTISFFSCTDENTEVTRTKQEQLVLDIDRIKGYIDENNLSAGIKSEIPIAIPFNKRIKRLENGIINTY